MKFAKKFLFLFVAVIFAFGTLTTAQAAGATEPVGPNGEILPGDTIPTWDPGMDEVTLEEPAFTPFINPVNCGNRIDWYRVITTGGVVHCYASAGETSVLIKKAWTFCPGSNKARSMFMSGGFRYWTEWRGPVSNHNQCWSFKSSSETIERVAIS